MFQESILIAAKLLILALAAALIAGLLLVRLACTRLAASRSMDASSATGTFSGPSGTPAAQSGIEDDRRRSDGRAQLPRKACGLSSCLRSSL
jgi:hypothetical protein